MHMPWEDVQLFLAIAEGKSLTAAARRLRVTQPTASRRLAQLEATVGEPLFARSVAGVALTAAGEKLLEPARRMAEWAGEVERAAEKSRHAKPQGVVRITAAPGLAFDVLAPFAAWLRGKLPEVTLEVVASVNYLDVARREADLAMRVGPAPTDLVSLAARDFRVGVFVSEAYAKTLPPDPKPADVAWIGWAPPLDHMPPNSELARLIPGWKPAFATDDYLVQLRAAEAGVGAMFLPRARHRFSDVVPSPLVEIDVGFPPISRTIRLVCAKSALDIPRVRAVGVLLAEELERAKELPPIGRKKRR